MRTIRLRLTVLNLLVVLGISAPSFAQENLLKNSELTGAGGVVIGDMTLDSPVPDSWRAFAVGGSVGSFRVTPLAAGELFPDSPAVNAACLSISSFDGDYGFDHDFADNRVQLIGGADYVGEFWVKSGNVDGSDQAFVVLFPIFNAAGAGLLVRRRPTGRRCLDRSFRIRTRQLPSSAPARRTTVVTRTPCA